MPKLDFSNYQHDDYDKRQMLISNSESIEFDFLLNKVDINAAQKEMNLYVSYSYEEWDDFYENDDSIEEVAPDEEDEEETDDDNDKTDLMYDKLCEKFNTEVYFSNPAIKESPPYSKNKFSAKKIIIPLGEGIIDFCYADFSKHNKLFDLYLALNSNELSESLNGKKREPIKISNADHLFNYKCNAYSRLMFLSDFFYSSLYTATFPPFIKNETEIAINRYLRYIHELQKEFLSLVEFCFDIDFYPEVMNDLTTAERFHMYADINETSPTSFDRTEQFRMSLSKMSGIKMPFGLTHDELIKRFKGDTPRTKQHEEFENKYNFNKGRLHIYLKLPKFISIEYSVSTIHDMLYLEFTKMLEFEIRLKKCRRCDKYFVMKGNYQTEYCDRSTENSYSCQTLAAQENYKSKIKENEAWALYNKYYKRYFARSKVGTIKSADFRKWQYEATLKRDLCQSGELDIGEYEGWLFGSFQNRTKKI